MRYNWQQDDWPQYRYDLADVDDALYQFAEQIGQVSGIVKSLPEDVQMEAVIDTMVAEAIKTSEIEGEFLSRKDVKSSIRNKLGLNQPLEPLKDRLSRGAGELIVAVRSSYQDPLSAEMLFSWHTMLLGENRHVAAGAWRSHEDPMQVVSGPIGKEKVHFEAPPSSQVAKEMDRFISWFNDTSPMGAMPIKKPVIRSAIAHLYFESIHPFEDGNGRIGRAIAEKALSQSLGRPVLLSLSRTIEKDKKAYYNALESAQKSNEITHWVQYFAELTLTAQRQANELIGFLLKKSQFLDRYKSFLNDRQLKVVIRMLEAGPEGFEGGMNARKYISISKVSKATATRDLAYLLELGILNVIGGGRSTNYSLNI